MIAYTHNCVVRSVNLKKGDLEKIPRYVYVGEIIMTIKVCFKKRATSYQLLQHCFYNDHKLCHFDQLKSRKAELCN